MSTSPIDCEAHLARFGLRTFRPGQREVVEALLRGDNCLCIMPTGGGKSLCYQMPSVMRSGVTLVVSPLIALMKDQVDALSRIGIAATCINSTIALADQHDRLRGLAEGRYDLVYIAPERFRSPMFGEALARTQVQLLAIDEAHCISEWGHDFRHDYSRLGQFRRQLGDPQTIALTATATEDVRRDILQQLRLEGARTFVAGFARDNLHYEVRTTGGRRDKLDELTEFLRQTDGAGIVYVSTRKQCGEAADHLVHELGEAVLSYHGGMIGEDRRVVQEQFMNDEARVVVATNAFGMGIDKPDVRFVVHFNMPGTLEAYYQEAGRAGRDGLPSRCILFYSASDRYIQEFFIENSFPSNENIARVYEYLRGHANDPIEVTQEQIKETLGLSLGAEGVGTCERLLEKAGILQRLEPQRNMAAVRLDSDLPTLVDLLPAQARAQRRVLKEIEYIVGSRRYDMVYFQPQQLLASTQLDAAAVARALRELQRLDVFDYVPPFRGRAVHMRRKDLPFEQLELNLDELKQRHDLALAKLERMESFCRSKRKCRQRTILEYFGDPAAADCGHCDNCDQAQSRSKRSARTVLATGGSSTADAVLSGGIHDETSGSRDDGGRETAVSAAAVVDRQRLEDRHPSADSASTAGHAEPWHVEATELIQKVLSGVVRCGRKGRFGKQMVVNMLCGSRSSKLSRWKLDELSTFGILKELRRTDVASIVDRLIEYEMIEISDVDRFRPVIDISEMGREVLHGRASADAELLDSLIQYVQPSGSASRGVRARVDQPSPSPVALSRAAGAAVSPHVADDAIRPAYYWTWRLLTDGYRMSECQAIRRLDRPALMDDLVMAARAGWAVQPDWVWTQQQQDRLADWARAGADPGDSRLWPPGCDRDDVRLYPFCCRSVE